MRSELYEEYKNEHPEELEQINRIFSECARIEARRAEARAAKLDKVNEWKRRLDNE